MLHPGAVSFSEMQGSPCLMLLGEPGIGKTTAMASHYSLSVAEASKTGDAVRWVDLNSFQTDAMLVREIFESDDFQEWLNGTHRLHLFLDSLDECLLRIDCVTALLIKELNKCPIERLALRIACRTVDWPEGMEGALTHLWENQSVDPYELLPLRRLDVQEAARIEGVDPQAFLAEIEDKQAVPLAIKPITLAFLLNKYRKEKQLPTRQAMLYRDGCRLLCEELNQSRRDSRQIGSLTAEQRLMVAGRLAAVTTLGNRFAVWTGTDLGEIPESDVAAAELVGGSEEIDDNAFVISEAAILETLGTGLFSARGPHRLGWAHKTYAEFLAAFYLVNKRFSPKQILTILTHPGDPEANLIPQLHETAVWVAGMVPDVFNLIMEKEPEVLLKSDVAAADVSDRERLVDKLLISYDKGKLLDRDRNLRSQYRKLSCPTLAEQLRPYIRDTSKDVVARRAAIQMAYANEVKELQGDLLDIALDPQQSHDIRVNAAYSLVEMGDEEMRLRLKPLAEGTAGEDPDDELKGCGLSALWPSHLTAADVFSILSLPKRESLFGVYRRFLLHELPDKLKPEDLPIALDWILKNVQIHAFPYALEGLKDAIILKAWQSLEIPAVLDAFAITVLLLLKSDHEIISRFASRDNKQFLGGQEDRRLLVAKRVMQYIGHHEEENLFWLGYGQTSLINSADVPWIIDIMRGSKSDVIQSNLAKLVRIILDWRNPDHLDAIIVSSREIPALQREFDWFLNFVEFTSPRAEEMKNRYAEEQSWQQRPARPPLDPPPDERIITALNQCEPGAHLQFIQLTFDMTLEPNSTEYPPAFSSDLTDCPGWKNADPSIRARIIEAAKQYIFQVDPETASWLGSNTYPYKMLTGYKAFRLIFREAPMMLSVLTTATWQKWIGTLLTYPIYSDSPEEEFKKALLKVAYPHAADDLVNCVFILIDKANGKSEPPFELEVILGIWDDRLGKALLAKVQNESLSPPCLTFLLEMLLKQKAPGANAFVRSLVQTQHIIDPGYRNRALTAARCLLFSSDDAGWSEIWPTILADVAFGRDLIAMSVDPVEGQNARIPKKLSEDQLADLFIWVANEYPYSEDPNINGAGPAGSRQGIAWWKNAILHELIARGNYSAVHAMQRIASALPQLDWLRWSVYQALESARIQTWTPAKPQELVTYFRDQDKRLVQNGNQLLEVIIESLERMEARLQGETPAAIYLWNKIDQKLYRPKDENELSDFVKIHFDSDLRDRGIIVNREVEIRRGQETDIRVDALVRKNQDIFDQVTVIIETKGCWHRELEVAMERQLLDRYLRENRCQYGLYLVGWFSSDKWDDGDYRKRVAPSYSIEEARRRFEDQAAQVPRNKEIIRSFVLDITI